MPETSVSLLERLRSGPDSRSWRQFIDLYTPLIRSWLVRHPLQATDTDDLVQDVLQVVVRELPHFRHNLRVGAFRCWLKAITVNRLRSFRRSAGSQPVATGGSDFDHMLDQLADDDSALSQLWNEEHDRHVIRRLLELIGPEFEPATWQAFQLLVLEERPTAEVAQQLGITVNAVRIAKSRVLGRLREEAEGLVD